MGDIKTAWEEFYDVVFDENPSPEMKAIQQQIRIREECEAHPDLDTPPDGFDTDHRDSFITTISCVPVHYRFPGDVDKNSILNIVIGVLSGGPSSKSRRASIRSTWGEGNSVFFIVAGPWKEIEGEYNEYGDILWVDQPEEYISAILDPHKGALTFKTQVFMTAMYAHVIKENPQVEFVYKTDDDCYVNVPLLKQLIMSANDKKTINYGGGGCRQEARPLRREGNKWFLAEDDYPFTYFPWYCIGSGYFLSTKLLECVIGQGHVAKVPYVTHEDVATGMLAERCEIGSSRINFGQNVFLKHNVKTHENMLRTHEKALAGNWTT